METKTLSGKLEFKFAQTSTETDTGTISGYGAVFGNVDSYGDIIAPGAFTKTLAKHQAAGTMPFMPVGHNYADLPVGVWTNMSEDDFGLKVEGSFLPSTVGQDARVTAKAGQITGLSIGFFVTGFEMKVEDGETNRIITEVELVEVSLVILPANDLARVSTVKSKEPGQALSVAVIVDASDAEVKLERAVALASELKLLVADLEIGVSVKSADEEVVASDEVEQEDAQPEVTGENEHKYNEAVIAAITQIRTDLGELWQRK